MMLWQPPALVGHKPVAGRQSIRVARHSATIELNKGGDLRELSPIQDPAAEL
jgi:hypothetical protein